MSVEKTDVTRDATSSLPGDLRSVKSRDLKEGETGKQREKRRSVVSRSPTANAAESSVDSGHAARQIADSERILCRLLNKSNQKIDILFSERNGREESRRIRDENIRQELRSLLLTEAEDSSRKNASVAMKWTDLFSIEVPQDLLSAMEAQQALCHKILQSKDDLISELKKQVAEKDNEYIELLKRQSDELNFFVRITQGQETEMKAAYTSEIKELEQSFAHERSSLLENHKRQLTEMDEKRNRLEQEYMDRFIHTAEEYEAALKEMRLNDVDEYNSLKAKLETDIQTLEQHLESMRATYQLNAEKLEYNYRVLMERDAENSATITQQKRKLSKQRDVLCGLKAKHCQLEKKFHSDNQHLTDEYQRITEHFNELQLKFGSMERHEVSKFEQLWQMKEGHVFALVRKLLDADRVIQQDLLGWDWMPPNEAIFKFELKSLGSETKSNLDSSTMGGSHDNELDDEVRGYIDSGAYHAALSMMCDETGFLLDDKALAAIKSVPANEQGYVRAEEVVWALGVRDASAFEALIDALMTDENKQTDLSPAEDSASSHPGMEMTGQQNHLVHPNEVLKRLQIFVENEIVPQESLSVPKAKTKRKSTKAKVIGRRALRKEALFWERLSNSVSSSTYQTWKVLRDYLTRYHKMLQSRREDLTQVGELRTKNRKLKQMLNQYLTSPVNEELAVPPVQTI